MFDNIGVKKDGFTPMFDNGGVKNKGVKRDGFTLMFDNGGVKKSFSGLLLDNGEPEMRGLYPIVRCADTSPKIGEELRNVFLPHPSNQFSP